MNAGTGHPAATPAASAPARWATAAAGVLGLTGVAAGAFGAHALKARLEPDALAIFDTAARYQMLHALALLGCAGAARQWPGRAAQWAIGCFVAGTLVFSGSLYALSLGGLRVLGAVTPLGGLMLLAGWLFLTLAALRR